MPYSNSSGCLRAFRNDHCTFLPYVMKTFQCAMRYLCISSFKKTVVARCTCNRPINVLLNNRAGLMCLNAYVLLRSEMKKRMRQFPAAVHTYLSPSYRALFATIVFYGIIKKTSLANHCHCQDYQKTNGRTVVCLNRSVKFCDNAPWHDQHIGSDHLLGAVSSTGQLHYY